MVYEQYFTLYVCYKYNVSYSIFNSLRQALSVSCSLAGKMLWTFYSQYADWISDYEPGWHKQGALHT